MRRKTLQWAGLGLVLALLAVGKAPAQEYMPPDPQWPIPLFSTHPYEGGVYLWGQYVMYQQTNTIQPQQIAYRGFVPTSDEIGGAGTAGALFIGSRQLALDTNQLQGPTTAQPGFEIGAGYKFKDGSTLSVSWMWLTETSYTATATLAAPNYQYRSDQADTFLTSFVYNFPPEFAGPALKVAVAGSATGGAGAVFGIWNGASIMTEQFFQRFNMVDIRYRKPVYENETYRLSGVLGPRFVWLWEDFRWVTTDLDLLGEEQPFWVGQYDSIVSNRMYGGFIGCQQEKYFGKGFAGYLTLEAMGFLDAVDTQALYALQPHDQVERKRTIHSAQFVPAVRVTPGIMWYPIEGVQINIAYDFMGFFNTVATPQPVDFNYSSVNPIHQDVFRYFSGFQAGMSIAF